MSTRNPPDPPDPSAPQPRGLRAQFGNPRGPLGALAGSVVAATAGILKGGTESVSAEELRAAAASARAEGARERATP